jgi:hypothetical protein
MSRKDIESMLGILLYPSGRGKYILALIKETRHPPLLGQQVLEWQRSSLHLPFIVFGAGKSLLALRSPETVAANNGSFTKAVLPEGSYTNLCHSGQVSFLAPASFDLSAVVAAGNAGVSAYSLQMPQSVTAAPSTISVPQTRQVMPYFIVAIPTSRTNGLYSPGGGRLYPSLVTPDAVIILVYRTPH